MTTEIAVHLHLHDHADGRVIKSLDQIFAVLSHIQSSIAAVQRKQHIMADEQNQLNDTVTSVEAVVAKVVKTQSDVKFELAEIATLLRNSQTPSGVDPSAVAAAVSRLQTVVTALESSNTALQAVATASDATPGTTVGGDPVPQPDPVPVPVPAPVDPNAPPPPDTGGSTTNA